MKEWLFLILVFFSSFLAYTWSNHFPYFYHSDEESKALQILYGYRNYWHPMLMLNATETFCRLLGITRDPQTLTEVGRTIAAFCSALGVVLVIRFAFERKGFLVGILTGLLLLACPLLFEVSHYCKEDPALFMALALSLLTWNCFLKKPNVTQAVYLGLCAGLAVSAKYPGVVLLPLFFLVILFGFKNLKLAFVFLAVGILSILAINWQWIFHFQEMLTGFAREKAMLTAGHDGVSTHLPHSLYLQILRYEHGWLLLFVAIFGIVIPLIKGAGFTLELALASITIIALVCLSCFAKVSDRYLLPVMFIIIYLAANGVVSLGQLFPIKYRPLVFFLLFAIISLHQTQVLTTFIGEFRTDSRTDLTNWMNAHLPKDDKVATSLWTRLPGRYYGQYLTNITPLDYVADHGTISELKESGYQWLAVTDVETQRFANGKQIGTDDHQAAFQRRRTFYRSLKEKCDLVWQEPPGLVYVLHPGLSLYRIR